MSKVTTPRGGIAIAGNLPATPEMLRWMWDVDKRIGSVTGSSADDLTLSQFEDAGIEEVKANAYAMADIIGQLPAQQFQQPEQDVSGEIAALREEVQALRQAIEALLQGVTA